MTNTLRLPQSGCYTGGRRWAPLAAIAVFAGLTFVSTDPSLAASKGGPAFGWGGNSGGGYGDCDSNAFCGQTGIDDGPYILSPGAIIALPAVVALGTGTFHSLAARSDGSVWAWGNNGSGQLGSGGATGAYSVSPVQVPGVSNATAIAGGFHHSLALRSDGSVWVWGSGFIGTGAPYATFSGPVEIPDLFDITSVAAGENWSYAVRADGTLWSWGFNGNGQLGDGTYETRWSPVQVQGLSGVVAAASHFAHALALGSDGNVWAWGWNPDGLLGIGSTEATQPVPAQVTGLTDVVEIAAGGFHSLAKKSDGTLWSWGRNAWGQLGLGTQTTAESTPMLVGGLGPLGAFAAGRVHSLAAEGFATFTSNTTLTEDHVGSILIDADDVTLDCAGHTVFGPGVPGFSGGINIAGGLTGVTVRHCTVTGFGVNGIFAGGGASHGRYEANVLYGNANHGIHLDFGTGNLVIGNTSRSNGGLGIVLTGSTDSRIEGNSARDNENWAGIALFSGSHDNVVVRNTAFGNAFGFLLESSSDNTLRGNRANNNAFDGFQLLESTGNTLTGNTAIRNGVDGGAGFVVRSSSGNTLGDNTANNNAEFGFLLESSSENTLRGNRANHNGQFGFLLASSSDNDVQKNKACANGSLDAFQDDSSTGNVFDQNHFCTTDGFSAGTTTRMDR